MTNKLLNYIPIYSKNYIPIRQQDLCSIFNILCYVYHSGNYILCLLSLSFFLKFLYLLLIMISFCSLSPLCSPSSLFSKQDELLWRAVRHFKGKNWKKIGNEMKENITSCHLTLETYPRYSVSLVLFCFVFLSSDSLQHFAAQNSQTNHVCSKNMSSQYMMFTC